jgi:hypothetical protein
MKLVKCVCPKCKRIIAWITPNSSAMCPKCKKWGKKEDEANGSERACINGVLGA